jgi:hypothetical protein
MAASAAIRALVSKLDGSVPSQVIVELRPPLAQLRTLRELPPVRTRDLLRLVKQQRDRFFRTTSDMSVVSAQWLNRKAGETIANVALAELDVLESIEATLVESGVHVQHFLATRDRDDGGIALLTPSMASARARARRKTMLGALALVASGWLVPPVIYVADLSRDHHALDAELTQVDSSLARIDSLEVRMAAFVEFASAFRRQSADSAWASVALAEITVALPANVHLHAIRLQRDGPALLQLHSSDGPQARDSILAHWPSGQIEGDATSGAFIVDLGSDS